MRPHFDRQHGRYYTLLIIKFRKKIVFSKQSMSALILQLDLGLEEELESFNSEVFSTQRKIHTVYEILLT